MRDVDLLKYEACIVLIVVGYMAAWTAVTMDHLGEGNTMLEEGQTIGRLSYGICKSRMWDYIIEIGECSRVELTCKLARWICVSRNS